MMLINVAAVLLAPTLIGPLVRLLRPRHGNDVRASSAGSRPTRSCKRRDGRPRRCSALMISLGFVLTLAGLTHAFRVSYTTWMNGVHERRLHVTASQRFFAKAYRLPPEFATVLPASPACAGSRSFAGFTSGTAEAAVPRDPAARSGRSPAPGDADRRGDARAPQRRRCREDAGSPSPTTSRGCSGKRLGDPVTLDTPGGSADASDRGDRDDYSSDQGTIWMDRSVYLRYWKDVGVDTIDILLAPQADRAADRGRRFAPDSPARPIDCSS